MVLIAEPKSDKTINVLGILDFINIYPLFPRGGDYGFGMVLYSFISIFGVMAYGDGAKELVYFNFKVSSAVKISQCALCIILLLTFPIQSASPVSFIDYMFPAVHLLLRRFAICHWRIVRPWQEGDYVQCCLDIFLGGMGIVAVVMGLHNLWR